MTPGVLGSKKEVNNSGDMSAVAGKQEDIRHAFKRALSKTKEPVVTPLHDPDEVVDVAQESGAVNSSPSSSTASAKENSAPPKKRGRNSSTNRNLMITYSPKKRKRRSQSNPGPDTGKRGRPGRGRPSSSRNSTVGDSPPEVPSSGGSVVSFDARSTSSSILRACRRNMRAGIEKEEETGGDEDKKEAEEDDDLFSVISGSSRRSSSRRVKNETPALEANEEKPNVNNVSVVEEEKEDETKEESADEASSEDDGDSEEMDTSDEENANNDVYVVERIDDKRLVEGVPFYFIKWKGWHETANTWEPVENLDGCPELLEAFEKQYAEKKRKRRNPSGGKPKRRDSEDSVVSRENAMEECQEHMKSYGILPEWPFDKEPLSVEGVLNVDGVLTYVVKRKARLGPSKLNRANAVLVHADGFKTRYPDLVIRYYEKRVLWVDNPKSDEEMAYLASQMTLFSQYAGSALGKRIEERVDREIKSEYGDMENDVDTQVIDSIDPVPKDPGSEDDFGLPEDLEETDISSGQSDTELEEEPDKRDSDAGSVGSHEEN